MRWLVSFTPAAQERVTLPAFPWHGRPFPVELNGRLLMVTLDQAVGTLVVEGEGGVERIYRIRTQVLVPGTGDGDVRILVEFRTPAGRGRADVSVSADVPGLMPPKNSSKDQRLIVKSQITGKVVKILVAPGQRVAPGEVLMIVEAMKMENRVFAPEAGRVEVIAVKEGGAVAVGREILRLVRLT